MLITSLKILSIIIAGVTGIWQVLQDFKDKKRKYKKTLFVYASLIFILLILSFKIGDLEEEDRNLFQKKQFTGIIDSSKELFSLTTKQMQIQYESLTKLNKLLKFQNMELSSQLDLNKKIIDKHFIQVKDIQDRIWVTSQNSLEELLKVSNDTKENLKSISQINQEINNLSIPISPFKFIVTLKYKLKDTIMSKHSSIWYIYPEGHHLDLAYTIEPLHFLGGNDKQILNYDKLVENFSKFTTLFREVDVSFSTISFDYKVHGNLPYFLYGDVNHLYQDIEIQFYKIKNNPLNLRNFNEVFDNSTVTFYFQNLIEKDHIFKLLLQDKNGKLNRTISFQKISFLPRLTMLYGNDYSLTKEFDNKESYSEVKNNFHWASFVAEKYEIFENGITFKCDDFRKQETH